MRIGKTWTNDSSISALGCTVVHTGHSRRAGGTFRRRTAGYALWALQRTTWTRMMKLEQSPLPFAFSIHGLSNALGSNTQGKSRLRENCTLGSAGGRAVMRVPTAIA